MPEVVTLGESMALFVTEPARPLRTAQSFIRSIAGAESNVAIGVARLGHTAGWIGRVGDDPLGLGILDRLRAEGVDVTHAVVDGSAPTGVLIRDRHAERPIQVLYHRAGSAGSRLAPGDVDEGSIARADVVHLTGITPALSPTARLAVQQAADVARDNGVTVTFDPNLRLKLWSAEEAAAVLQPLVGVADVVFAGEREATLLSGRDDVPEEWFLEQGARLVVTKQGADGAHATDGTTRWFAPAFPVQPADVIGAGDAFAAGFIVARLEGAGVEAALRTGNAVGAMATQVPGDIDGLPYRADLEAFRDGAADVDR